MEARQQTPPVAAFNSASTATYAPSNKNKRVIAFIIDALISGVFSKLLGYFVVRGFHLKNALLVSVFSALLVAVFYWVALTLVMGATPGKKIMGLRIVRKDHTLDVGFGQLLLRETIGRLLSMTPLCLGYLWVSWDKERRTFHDMVSGTRVVDFR